MLVAVPAMPWVIFSPARRTPVTGAVMAPVSPLPTPLKKPPTPFSLAPVKGLLKIPPIPFPISWPKPEMPCLSP
jgi:hypothetical protein